MSFSWNGMNYYGSGAAGVLILLLALAGAVVTMALFLPRKKRGTYQGFAARLYDFLNFNSFWLPVIVKVTYLFLTIYTILGGLYIMISASFFAGLLTIVLGPIVMRLMYEVIFVLYSMREQLQRSNELLERIANNGDMQKPQQQAQETAGEETQN